MKRITPQEAEYYVPCHSDYRSDGIEAAEFYTLTPSLEEGFEDVIYYTPKKVFLYEGREGDGDSWVYILTNDSIPNKIKIGYTKLMPEERAKQMSRATGVATPFDVAYAFRCFNAEQLEGEVHKALRSYRVRNDREFFRIPLIEAIKSIKNIGEKYI